MEKKCICGHIKENHKGWRKKKDCKHCDCVQYINVNTFRHKRKEEEFEEFEEEYIPSKNIITLDNVPQLVITLLVIAIVLGVGATVLVTVQEETVYNTTSSMLDGYDVFSSFESIFVVIVAAAVVLGVISENLFRT